MDMSIKKRFDKDKIEQKVVMGVNKRSIKDIN